MSAVLLKKKTYEFRITPFNTISGSIFIKASNEAVAMVIFNTLEGVNDWFEFVGEVVEIA